jgi:hypothetical protein
MGHEFAGRRRWEETVSAMKRWSTASYHLIFTSPAGEQQYIDGRVLRSFIASTLRTYLSYISFARRLVSPRGRKVDWDEFGRHNAVAR